MYYGLTGGLSGHLDMRGVVGSGNFLKIGVL